jgi:hypothetical protein
MHLTPQQRADAEAFAGSKPFEVATDGTVQVARAASSFDAVLAAMGGAGRVEVKPVTFRLIESEAQADARAEAKRYQRALQQQIDRPDELTIACTGGTR